MKLILIILLLSINVSYSNESYGIVDSCKSLFEKFFKGPIVSSSDKEKTAVRSLDSDKDYVKKQHLDGTFTTGRGLREYFVAFNRTGYETLTLKKRLDEIKSDPNAHWLDAGGGMGRATSEFYRDGAKSKMTLVSVETDAENLLSPSGNEIQRKVIKGKFIEDISDNEILKSDLITDLYGPMAYSAKPDKVLDKYLKNLKEDGEIYIFLGEGLDTFGKLNQVITKEGKVIDLSEWLEGIAGIKVETVKINNFVPDTTILNGEKARIVKISKKKNEDIVIPSLTRLTFEEGGPQKGFVVPRMIFSESKSSSIELPNNQKILNSNDRLIHDFRSGEIEHVLLDKIENLKGEKWIHFSNEKNIFDGKNLDLKNEAYFEFGTKRIEKRFKAISQKDIQPLIGNDEMLQSISKVKLITDHNGNIFSKGTPDQMLRAYLSKLSDDGTILISLGDDIDGFLNTKIVTKDGGTQTFIKWLNSIPGIQVKHRRNEEIKKVTLQRLKSSNASINLNQNGEIEDFPSRESFYSSFVEIKIKNKNIIKIPELEYLGKISKKDSKYELPLLRQK